MPSTLLILVVSAYALVKYMRNVNVMARLAKLLLSLLCLIALCDNGLDILVEEEINLREI